MSSSSRNIQNQRNIRSFIAIEIPNQSTLQKIQAYQEKLQKSIGPLKLVSPHLMHITLKFLGNITLEEAKLIKNFLDEELSPVYFPENKIYEGKFVGVGDFNRNVFFINIQGVFELLQELNTKIETYLEKFAEIKKETRAFRPHLTIARKKRNRYSKSSKSNVKQNPGQIPYFQLKEQYQHFEFGEWTISRICLKKSILTPQGPIYSEIEF